MGTEYCNTSVISDVYWLAVSLCFLGIRVLLKLFHVQYCACVRAVVPLLSIVLASFGFLLQRGGEQTSYM